MLGAGMRVGIVPLVRRGFLHSCSTLAGGANATGCNTAIFSQGCAGGKFVVSGTGERYDSPAMAPNRKFRSKVVGCIFPVSRAIKTEIPVGAILLRTEGIFHMLRKMSSRICTGAVLLLVAVFLFSNFSHATTQDNSKNKSTEKITVVAHLPLPGSAVRQMFLQQESGKRYLYLQQNVNFTVVDVTDPKNPRIVERVASVGKLTDVGAGLAIAVQADQSGQGSAPTQTIRLVDLSDPKNPHTVKKFDGVSSVYSEDGRQLIYITNNEGLWVVKHYEAFRLPFCTSESEENSVAQCQ
jgi:hypothetical protein